MFSLHLFFPLSCTIMVLIKRPSILLLLGFLKCMFQLAYSSTNFTDQLALIAFGSKIDSGPNNTVLAVNLSTTTNFCSWIGVSCSRWRQRVTALNLSYMGLRNTISPHIGNLFFLVYLNLCNNSFFGSLTHEIGRLRRLRILQLSSNLSEGSIPSALHNCLKLLRIALSANHLVGVVPSTIGNMPWLEWKIFSKLFWLLKTKSSETSCIYSQNKTIRNYRNL